MNNPTACIVVIGNEILSGRTQDKNIAYIAQGLAGIGVNLREVRVIPDVERTIIDTVNELRAKFSYVFTTGGIGPTHDDITSASVAKAFGVPIHRHPEAEATLRAHYTKDDINEARLKMADVPEGASLITNPVSAAPGFIMGNVHVMAGVPRIMQAMFDSIRHTLNGGTPVTSVNVSTDLPEGTLAEGLTRIDERYMDVDIGSYPLYRAGGFFTTLVMRGTSPEQNEAAAHEVRALIASLGGHEITDPGQGQ